MFSVACLACPEGEGGPAMTTAPQRLGERPTLREDLDRALDLIAALTERVAVLESARDVDEQIDGAAPAALPPSWKPLKQAAAETGYSASGLRKIRAPQWWKYVAGRVWVDTATCPRKASV
jgi:hypothetical protein